MFKKIRFLHWDNNSNTTLVKVKSLILTKTEVYHTYSNTTLVKVKFISDFKTLYKLRLFKYNSC